MVIVVTCFYTVSDQSTLSQCMNNNWSLLEAYLIFLP